MEDTKESNTIIGRFLFKNKTKEMFITILKDIVRNRLV
jgi:hypothetical protein